MSRKNERNFPDCRVGNRAALGCASGKKGVSANGWPDAKHRHLPSGGVGFGQPNRRGRSSICPRYAGTAQSNTYIPKNASNPSPQLYSIPHFSVSSRTKIQ